MDFQLKEVLYIIAIFASGLTAFLATRHKLKEYIRDKIELIRKEVSTDITDIRKENKQYENSLLEKVNSLKLELKDLKMRDELQQQVIDQIGKNMDDLIPKLIEATHLKSKANG